MQEGYDDLKTKKQQGSPALHGVCGVDFYLGPKADIFLSRDTDSSMDWLTKSMSSFVLLLPSVMRKEP